MKAQDDAVATDVSEETEPESKASEQTQTEIVSTDYAEELLKLAADDGHTIGYAPPEEPGSESETPVVEAAQKPESEESETEPETEDEPEEEKPEELKPAAKKDDVWPDSAKTRVAEETAKRKRANERADLAEATVAQLQETLLKVVGPQPTEADPFVDVQDIGALERLERSYEKMIDDADEDPESLVEQVVEVEKKKSGVDLLKKFTPEEILARTRKKAEKAIRKFVPERRDYLTKRAQADAQAVEVYPELKDPNSEFTQSAAVMAQRLLTGEAARSPDALIWIARAIRGYQMELQEANGNGVASVKSPGAKKIVQSSRQKIAPTPTRSRSFVERGSSSAALEKAQTKFEARGDTESAEELVGALLSRNAASASKRLEPMAE